MVLAMPRALFSETAATFGATVSWVGGGLVCAALVGLALLVPALRDYDARAPQVENRVP
jgi:hypothetical protein